MGKIKRSFMRVMSLVLVIAMMLPTAVNAYFLMDDETIDGIISTESGEIDTTDDAWRETYPYGAFALSHESIYLNEGEEETITVYRVGGSEGKAIAFFSYEPMVFAESDGITPNYSMAISDGDIAIYVEDDQPIAAYQPIGGEGYVQAKTCYATVSQSSATEVTDEEDAGVTYNEITLTPEEGLIYDSIQWYAFGIGTSLEFGAIEGATEAELNIADTELLGYDFRYEYVVDGQKYVSTSIMGEVYEEWVDYDGEVPEDVPLVVEQSFLPLNMDSDDAYSGYMFAMTFADGEYVKEIKLSSLDDEIAEALESATLYIAASEGAEIFSGAEKLILSIEDDEEPEYAEISIDSEIIVDKSAGTAKIAVTRTGGTTTALSIDYATVDGTATAGRDYASASGTLMFYAGIDTIEIEVELIDDKIATEDYIDFTVEISNLVGGGGTGSIIDNDVATVSLYNSATAETENLATMMYDSSVDDVSAGLTEADAVATVGETIVTGTQNVGDEGISEMATGGEGVSDWTSDNSFILSPANLGGSYGSLEETLNEHSYTVGRGELSGYGENWSYTIATDTSAYTDGIRISMYDQYGYLGETEDSRITILHDTNLYKYFSNMTLSGYTQNGLREYTVFNDLVTQPNIWIYDWTDGNPLNEILGSSEEWSTVQNLGTMNYSLDYSSNNLSSITVSQSRISGITTAGIGSENCGWISLTYDLQRRVFASATIPTFTIVTANDVDTAPDGAAVLSSDTYKALVPTFDLGNAGFDSTYGKLFVGSTIGISASANTAPFELVGTSTYSSASSSMYTWGNGAIDTNYFADTQVFNDATYKHYYVLNRKQDVKIDLTTSMDADSLESNYSNTIIAAQADFEENVTINFGVTDLQDGHENALNEASIYYDKNPFSDTTRDQAMVTETEISGAIYDYGIYNLQYIYFKSDNPADMLVLNGEGYISGNDGVYIWLDEALINSETISMSYWSEEFQSVPSTQRATIDSSYLYIDYSGDGTINGSYNATTGQFELDSNTTDEILMYIDPETDYEESLFAKEPYYDGSGNLLGYYEKFIVAKYSMNPRSIGVPVGEDASTKTQVLPSFISDATSQNPLYSGLSDEQKSYRYIVSGTDSSGYTSDNRERYGSEASAMQVIIVPCGGDESPVVATAGTNAEGNTIYSYTWDPDFKGNLLYEFESPSNIIIPHSLAGDEISIATGVLSGGTVTYSDEEKAELNGYLGSYVYIDTFALTVREQVEGQSTEDILGASYDPSTANSVTPDSTVIFSGGLRENSDYLQIMDDPASPDVSVDTADSGTSFLDEDEEAQGDMFDMNMGATLPTMDIAVLGDWLTIVMDGQSVGMSIGIPLGGYESTKTATTDGAGNTGTTTSTSAGVTPKAANADAFSAITNFCSSAAGKGAMSDSSYAGAVNAPGEKGGFESQSFSVSFSVQIGLMFTYNNLTGSYEFDTFTVSGKCELQFRYQYRFVSVPVLYVYFQLTGSIEVGLGLGVDYIEQSLNYDLIANVAATNTTNSALAYNYASTTLATGEYYTFSTDYDGGDADFRAFNITFNGELYLGTSDSTIRSGTIESDGTEPMTIVLTKDEDDLRLVDITLTATEDTTITKLDPVHEPISRVYFTGVELTPEVGIEIGGGVGVEVLKAELFVNAGIGATFMLGGYQRNPDDFSAEYECWVESFAMNIGLGLRLVALILNTEIDIVSYNIEYANDGGWSFYGSAFNGLLEFDEDGEASYLRTGLVSNPADTQTVYAPSNENIEAFAYQPTDGEAPFEYSGYASSADAFELVGGVQTGYDYQMITVDGRNFVVYTLGREGAENATESMMLVLSEILVTNENGNDVYGLVHPNYYASETNYVEVDNDMTGDLGFNVWAEGADINVAWVSYTADAVETESGGTLTDAEDIAYATARETVIKTASFDTESTSVSSFTVPTVISSSISESAVSMARGADGAVAYVEAVHYTDTELADMVQAHSEHVDTMFADYTGLGEFATASKEISLMMYNNIWNMSGSESNIHAVIDGAEVSGAINTAGQVITEMQMVESATDGTYYLAYTTQAYSFGDDTTYKLNDMITTSRLYLVSVDSVDGFGTPKLLRTIIDSALDDGVDGVYTSTGTLVSEYQSPYIASLSFLNGVIGDKLVDGEAAMMAETDPEDFLLFDMNGTIYVIRSEDMAKIVSGDDTAKLYPFFQTADGSPTGRQDVTIGADEGGNIAAVYTSTVTGSLSNALYISVYDPDTATWGDGTILAMRGLQIYEDSAAQDWSLEELRYAYLYAAADEDNALGGYTNDYGTLHQFNFSNIQIAMAGDTSVSEQSESDDPLEIIGEDALKRFGYDIDTDGISQLDGDEYEEIIALAEALNTDNTGLLILTQGSMVQLVEDEDGYADAEGDNRVSVYPDYSAEDTQLGIYAISFGFGEQKIGEESLVFSSTTFTKDSQLYSAISFKNTGDTAIRASAANPATVSLMLSSATEGVETVELASWSITENVKSGATVMVEGYGDALPRDLAEGDTLYFAVGEDENYITGDYNSTAFTATSLSNAAGYFVVENKAELAVENFNMKSLYLDDSGNTVAYVSFDVANRGSAEAEDVFVQFSYEGSRDSDGNAVYAPFDLTYENGTHGLSVSAEMELLAENSDIASGKLYLGEIGDDDGIINVGYYKSVSGYVIIQPEYYAGIASQLNLKVEVGSDETTAQEIRMADEVALVNHDEYNTLNNAKYATLTHSTSFAAPTKIVMAMGNTARIAVSAVASSGAPVLVAQEATDSVDSELNLGICYYDSANGTIVIVPSSEGTGKINLTDTSTNTTFPIEFTVTSEGEGINIYKDNEIFSFYDDNGTLYVEGATGDTGWNFVEGYWAYENGAEVYPVNNDYSGADMGSYFEFVSAADSITLKFSGSISVVSTLNGSTSYYDSDIDGETVTIDFDNTEEATHTIRVTATEADTRFDTVIETFGVSGAPTPSEDKTAPQIFWNRSFPTTASIDSDTGETVTLTAYVLDDTGLASVTVNGVSQTCNENDSGFWQFDLVVSENGTYTVTARDTSGTVATQAFVVDWFAGTVSDGAISTAPDVSAGLYYGSGDAIDGDTFLSEDDQAYIEVTTDSGNTITVTTHYISETGGWAETPTTLADTTTLDISKNGYYEAYVEASDGTWSRVFLKLSAYDGTSPAIYASYDSVAKTISFAATKNDDGGNAAQLTDITMNGAVLVSGVNAYTYTGSCKISYDGDYTFSVTDAAGSTDDITITVSDKFPVTATTGFISGTDGAWNTDLDNGSFAINKSAISGGQYDASASTPASGTYLASYEYTLLALEDDYSEDVITQFADIDDWYAQLTWYDLEDTTFTGLKAGNYAIYVRCATGTGLAPIRQEISIADESMSIAVSSTDCTKNLTDGTITVEATGGKDGTGYYQFAIEAITVSDEGEKSADEFSDWTYFDGDTAVFEELLDGDYQVAVRMAEGMTITQATAFNTAKSANAELDAVYGEIDALVDAAYAADTELWENAQTATITVGLYTQSTSGGGSSGSVVITTPEEVATIDFDDVDDDFWGKTAIDFVVERGLFGGVGDNLFAPDEAMTRAMFVTVLGRFADTNMDDYTAEVFEDVEPDSWYGPYVAWASENGIVNGYSDTQFGPNDNITREQMCVMLANFMLAMGIELEAEEVQEFADAGDCSDWAADSVDEIASYGLIEGTGDGAFEPQGEATRAAVATIFMRFIESIAVQ